MAVTNRWYIIAATSPSTGEIIGWSRTDEAAAARRPVNGWVIQASSRPQAARRANEKWGVTVTLGRTTVPLPD